MRLLIPLIVTSLLVQPSFAQEVSKKIEATESDNSSVKPAEDPKKLCANVGVNDEPREQCIKLDNYPEDVCKQVQAAATRHGLPLGFFARLIWKESLFNANARSHMGAEGIAQFIPSTAKIRGLKNVYNPVEALDKSAEYLAELNRRFGSLGMAAVAYNAGETRAAKYLADNPFMPYETQDYVMTITGQSVETWKQRPAIKVDYALIRGKEFMPSCLDLVARKPITYFANTVAATRSPFAVQLGAHAKKNFARRIFQKVQQKHRALLGNEKPQYIYTRNRRFGSMKRYAIRIGRPTRAEAVKLCQRLRAQGGICTVKRNPR